MDDKKPLFDVKEGADNFHMIDCEVRNMSGRPIMKSAAKNTQVIRLKLFNIEIAEVKKSTLKKWGFGGLIGAFVVGLLLLFVEYGYFA